MFSNRSEAILKRVVYFFGGDRGQEWAARCGRGDGQQIGLENHAFCGRSAV